MKSFKQHLNEGFDHSPKIGWWRDQKFLTVYHGTHEKNVPDIQQNGINRKDPKTGMISLTLDPHTAHGYAAMSSAGGEHHFRAVGGKAVTTPHENRAVVKMRIPMKWIDRHIDPNLRGNIGVASGRLGNKAEYDKWKGPDHEYYQMTEIRVSKEVPSRFIRGVMKRGPLKESRVSDALKAGLKKNWKRKLALALTPGPFGEIAALGMTARDAYRSYKGLDESNEEEGPWAIATWTKKGTLRRVPDTKFHTKYHAITYGEKYHRSPFGVKHYEVVLHPDAKKKDK